MSSTLSKYFSGIGAKRLSEVEIKPDKSNQHEFNGINEFKVIFGTDKIKFTGKFIYLSDDEKNVVEDSGNLTWYDARENHATRTEYRLYYSSNLVIKNATVGDLFIIGKTTDGKLVIVVAEADSTAEKQLLWLFGLAEVGNKFVIKDLKEEKQELGFAGNYVLSSLGIEIEDEAPNYLEEILYHFGEKFPTTNIFSEYARSTIKDVNPFEHPDQTLMAWMEREELLFRTLEKYLVQIKLKSGFGSNGDDVDDFIGFSLSVQNRRKSRAGFAFENHLSVIFDSNKILYSKGKVTELNKKPDFIFPGVNYYHSESFDIKLLTMLGLKTSSKDRWRQMISEAAKIKKKHFITLEPSISKNQTDEMISDGIQLVIPNPIIGTFTTEQQKQIMSLSDFIHEVLEKQSKI